MTPGKRGTRGTRKLLAACIGLLAASSLLAGWWFFAGRGARANLRFNTEPPGDLGWAVELRDAFEANGDLGTTLGRFPIPSARAGEVFNLGHRFVRHDPLAHHVYVANAEQRFVLEEHPAGAWTMRTNDRGLRNDANVAAERPDLRVLVVGDSHIDGICDNAEAFPARLADLLRAAEAGRSVEVLNAAKGGHSFYQYLGNLERFLDLEPDVFCMCVYGGNDFTEALRLHYLFQGKRLPWIGEEWTQRQRAAIAADPNALGQCYGAALYLGARPDQQDVAGRVAEDVTREIARLCAERGIGLVVCYLPPTCELDAWHASERFDVVREHAGLDAESALVIGELADRYLAFLAAEEIESIDLREPLSRIGRDGYWETDLHLALEGHSIVARDVHPSVERVFEERAR